MRILAWVAVGWVGTLVGSAWATRLNILYVLPDVPVLVVVFLAMRRPVVEVVLTAAALGYLDGRLALAPLGLNETAMVLCALGSTLAAGHLAGSGATFYALASGAATVAVQAGVALLLFWQRGAANFSSWATALLLPAALATAALALVVHPGLVWLERRLAPEVREGLGWR